MAHVMFVIKRSPQVLLVQITIKLRKEIWATLTFINVKSEVRIVQATLNKINIKTWATLILINLKLTVIRIAQVTIEFKKDLGNRGLEPLTPRM